MDPFATDQAIPLREDDAPPQVGALSPDVRSGTTFTYKGNGNTADSIQFVLVVWVYTVEPEKRADFAKRVEAFERAQQHLPSGGISYRGTYSVSISSVAPDFEYRTFWGLVDLGRIKDLNDYLRQPPPVLQQVLRLISPRPALRSEIMGLTRNSAPADGTLNPDTNTP